MRASKPHSFVAWLFDWYIVTFYVGGLMAGYLAVTGTTGTELAAYGILGFVLVSTTAYYMGLVKRLNFISPGERIAGCFRDGNTKVWRNPYALSRWPLFACMLTAAVVAGNTWGGIGVGEPYHVSGVLYYLLILTILTCSFLLVGRGMVWGMAGVAMYMAYAIVEALREPHLYGTMTTGLVVLFALIALASIGLWIAYANARPGSGAIAA